MFLRDLLRNDLKNRYFSPVWTGCFSLNENPCFLGYTLHIQGQYPRVWVAEFGAELPVHVRQTPPVGWVV